MYGLPPGVSVYDIAMGIFTKQLNALLFRRDKRISTDGSTTHSEKQMERQKYNGPYDDSKIPIVSIYSFLMAFLSPWEDSSSAIILDKSLVFWVWPNFNSVLDKRTPTAAAFTLATFGPAL